MSRAEQSRVQLCIGFPATGTGQCSGRGPLQAQQGRLKLLPPLLAVSKVLQLLAALRSKAAQLSEGGDRQWTAKEVEICLWAAANAGGDAAAGAAAASGGKRKR